MILKTNNLHFYRTI